MLPALYKHQNVRLLSFQYLCSVRMHVGTIVMYLCRQCQPGIIAGVVNPIAPGVPSQAPATASSVARRSSQSPSPTPVTSAGDSSPGTPFVVDPTLMMQPIMQTSADITDAYVRDFGRCGGAFYPRSALHCHLRCHTQDVVPRMVYTLLLSMLEPLHLLFNNTFKTASQCCLISCKCTLG